MEKIACWAATKVIPEGQGVKNTLQKNKITGKELKVIANGNINGINTDYFSPASVSPEQKAKLKRNLQIQDNDFVFCFVGRLVKDKGINELVNAFSQLSTLNTPLSFGEEQGVRLLLVGPFERELDPLMPETEHEIKKNQNIISVGAQTDVRPFMAISDVFVFPSYREGFPNVIMQAGAMELPCIVTDINGCNEIIEDSINGLIIPPKNTDKLREKMLHLMNNENLRKRLRSTARAMICSRYEQRMVWEAILNMYQNLIK
jgi:glycosyltransferase involved in cell wall biosynthesis